MRSLGHTAKACGLEPVEQGAGRTRVTEMMEAIRASSGPATSKAAAEGTYKSYLETFPKEEATTTTQEGEAKRVHARACARARARVRARVRATREYLRDGRRPTADSRGTTADR